MQNDQQLTTRIIAEQLNFNHITVNQVLTEELNMRKICAKLVPKNLTVQQKVNRMEVCRDLFRLVEIYVDFLKHVTSEKSWIFEYDPDTKQSRRLPIHLVQRS